VRRRWPFLPAATAQRMAHAYGTLLAEILGEAQCMEALGEDFGGGLTEAELRWLVAREWASSAQDILWRRTKLACLPG
jgi:glycerol-3-phosphate dehydrogenase